MFKDLIVYPQSYLYCDGIKAFLERKVVEIVDGLNTKVKMQFQKSAAANNGCCSLRDREVL